ncbi:hypothetical protein PAXRUDRAFT_21822 [Paxillus rubicundulus Ve08.2h10]|uniref:Uncharacterized protein n=1 Tax=Paxillus rubicundulus Ve08.2h10 TaxID=930991 RepID=A0A0D0CP46_9AGAM|nr:hypothetical protein PAXRUDRAFT_21822 [Paxillus rubicundulus Ve08.2h10]
MHPHSPTLQDPVGNPVVQSDLTDAEIGMLERRLPGWIECSKDKKGDNFKVVCDELRALPYVTTLNRSQWYTRKKSEYSAIQNVNWTARAVAVRTKKAEIIALIQEKKGAKPGEAEMISNYQWAISQVMGNMTEAELEEAEKEAMRWNSERPPLEVQANTAAHKGKQYACEFARTMWKQCGIRVVILEAWLNEAEQVMVGSHDFNSELDGGQSFDRLQDIQKDWESYTQESFSHNPDAATADTDSKVPHISLPKCKPRLDVVDLVTKSDGKPWVADVKQVSLDSLKNIELHAAFPTPPYHGEKWPETKINTSHPSTFP